MVKITKLPPGEENPELRFQQNGAWDKNLGTRTQKYYSPKLSETAPNLFDKQIEKLQSVSKRKLRQIIRETDVHDISDAPVESPDVADVSIGE